MSIKVPLTLAIVDGMVVVVEHGSEQFCRLVDELVGKQEIVIKSFGEHFKDLPGIAGAAIMGNGRVGLILDVVGLFKIGSDIIIYLIVVLSVNYRVFLWKNRLKLRKPEMDWRPWPSLRISGRMWFWQIFICRRWIGSDGAKGMREISLKGILSEVWLAL